MSALQSVFRLLRSFRFMAWALLACVAVRAGAAELDDPLQFSIAAQSLSSALLEFSQQSKIQVLTESEVLDGHRTAGVQGHITAREALTTILSGTGLSFRRIGDGTVTIRKADKTAMAAPVRLAAASAVGEIQSHESARNAPASAPAVEEIIVTARKREERLMDVPVPVTAINAQVLVDSGQPQLQDYFSRIPGLSLTPSDVYGGSTIAIRGLVTGLYSNPTVGIVVDDVQYASPSSGGFGFVVAEVDPSELARIEVLRGPQGTLYGASSIGGLIKYVTVDPSTDVVAGRLQAGTMDVHNGDQLGYSLRGAVNVPLTESWAIRASAFTRQAPGYLDDPANGSEGVNEGRTGGGRLSMLWRASENVTLRLGGLIQSNDVYAAPHADVGAGIGDLEQNAPPGSGGYRKDLQIYNADLQATWGQVEFAAVSAYALNEPTFLFNIPGFAKSIQSIESKRFTQELRVSMPLGERLEWQLGAFYSDEDTDIVQHLFPVDARTGEQTGGDLLNFFTTPQFEEYAAFTNLTVQVTDRFEVQIGGRVNENMQSYQQTVGGSLSNGGVPVVGPRVTSREDSSTYLLTPQFKVSANLMLYARLASGYRPGGPNTQAGFAVPRTFNADRTENYEIGVKGKLFDQAMSFDASLYHIDWTDVQIALTEPTFSVGYIDNAGRARSRGVELSVEVQPLIGLSLAGWVAYNDAELTETPPTSSVYALPGYRLPFGSRISGSLSVNVERPMGRLTTGFLGVSANYVGERKGSFTDTAARETLPSYAKADLSGGVRAGTWTVSAFLNNVADKRGVLSGGLGTFTPNGFTYIQPRTVGVSVSKTF